MLLSIPVIKFGNKCDNNYRRIPIIDCRGIPNIRSKKGRGYTD